ncbi:F/Y rich C-terminus-domain-containing protein [Halteromyces radiatus]|uniref:F/Y rich C-terminus-domain-containing protein n=1 Tax=Halteromyces radiatus TaxID=101107 RepID=UPI00221FBF01|nr:F/Y rich C-terminus-domain-containing protein [Halteromyces radiatus]KAI8096605.1 F/Y rich C-terminus-domain-containing protein [Halteromyces radiatus]
MLGSNLTTFSLNDNHIQKHRRMKRKLLDFITKHEEAKRALDQANQRIILLEARNRELKRQQASAPDTDSNDEEDIQEKPEKRKSRSVIKRRRTMVTLEDIPRDVNGKPILPVTLGPLKLISLGKIIHDKPAYHCARHIYPLGYTVERIYMSMVDPDRQSTYTCKVEEGEDDEPLFVVYADDDPENVMYGKTATACWTMIARGANKVRRKSCRNSISGPEYYGLANQVVRHLIEEMDHVDLLEKYKKSPF